MTSPVIYSENLEDAVMEKTLNREVLLESEGGCGQAGHPVARVEKQCEATEGQGVESKVCNQMASTADRAFWVWCDL
jgi:hypothetical protein